MHQFSSRLTVLGDFSVLITEKATNSAAKFADLVETSAELVIDTIYSCIERHQKVIYSNFDTVSFYV